MLKKIFGLIVIISFVYLTLGQLELVNVQTEEQYEEEGIKMIDKTVMICHEIENFGENTKLRSVVTDWGTSQSGIIRFVDKILSWFVLPINIASSLINMTFNIISILTGSNWRTNIPTSYGGGGGGFSGGR